METRVKGRSFELWDFTVSHGQLLIRSPRGSDEQHNTDIVFAGVKYSELPVNLGKVTLEEPTEDDFAHIRRRFPEEFDLPTKLFVLCGAKEMRYYVVAAYCKVSENDLEITESPLRRKFDPSVT
jgi:hypothetical protein